MTSRSSESGSRSSTPSSENMNQRTHHFDCNKVDTRLLLGIIENILPFSNRCVNLLEGTESRQTLLNDVTNISNSQVISSDLADIIDKLYCHIACQCPSEGGPVEITDNIIGELSEYSWDAKLVLMVAAFAVYYGEFGLLNLLYGTENGFASNIAVLKRVPNIIKDADNLRTLFIAITRLVEAILDTTILVVQFKDLLSGFLEPYDSDVTAEIERVVKETVVSIVNCALQIRKLRGMRDEHNIQAVASKISTTVNRYRTEVNQLKGLFRQCQDESVAQKAYFSLKEFFRVSSQRNNLEFLEAFFYLKNNQLPFVIGNTKEQVRDINTIIKDKEVLLLITSLDDSEEEIVKTLATLYDKPHSNLKSHYHIVWIPITDKPDKQKFKGLQSLMPWYTVDGIKVIKPEAKRYIREEWKFTKTQLSHFDSHGVLQSENVLDLMDIWGELTFPLNKNNLASLPEQPFTLDLLLRDINLIDSTKAITCIYGGEDIYWIKKLKDLAREVVKTTSISMELIYVNKSNYTNDELETTFDEEIENFRSRLWSEPKEIVRFWNRLDTIFKMRIGSVGYDTKTRDIMTLLSYSSSYQGWAVFAKSQSTKMAKASGKVVLDALSKLNNDWTGLEDDLIQVVNSSIKTVTTEKHCNHISLPPSNAKIVGEKMTCVICGRPMEMYQLMYRCCTD